jgi:hypothetical protein
MRVSKLLRFVLLGIGLMGTALAAASEYVTWDNSLYAPLEATLLRGDEAPIYTEDAAPAYVLTRFVVEAEGADDWVEALEVLNTLKRNEPKTPRQWFERFQAEAAQTCGGEFALLEQNKRSLTFVRTTPACPPHAAQVGLYRALYGKDQVFVLIATRKGVMTDEARAAWLALLGSAEIRRR